MVGGVLQAPVGLAVDRWGAQAGAAGGTCAQRRRHCRHRVRFQLLGAGAAGRGGRHRQQRLSSGRLCGAGRAHSRTAAAARLQPPHLPRFLRHRGGAAHDGDAGGTNGLAKRRHAGRRGGHRDRAGDGGERRRRRLAAAHQGRGGGRRARAVALPADPAVLRLLRGLRHGERRHHVLHGHRPRQALRPRPGIRRRGAGRRRFWRSRSAYWRAANCRTANGCRCACHGRGADRRRGADGACRLRRYRGCSASQCCWGQPGSLWASCCRRGT